MRIGVLHGPNLDLLGRREPDLYGHESLERIESALQERADRLGVELSSFQSNSEGALVDWIGGRAGEVDGWLVNAAAYTHTSLALRDALAATALPFVEVHLSNPYAREPVRRRSLLLDLAVGQVAGFRGGSYLLALEGLVEHLEREGGERDR